MGLLSNMFSGPSKEQIDRSIADLQAKIANLQKNIAIERANATGKSPSSKKTAQLNIAMYKGHIEDAKAQIAHLRAERKHAK